MLSGKDRRENWESLLEEFHGYLKQYCTGPLPFTVDQVGIRKVSEDAKLAVKTVLLEKTIALFEDILFFANRNREVRKNVKN
ncbi:hypothetical protein ANCDUO_11857 [Ancylostoma duodenale]|uniref:Uncharacterized protein n=1 Tax=Ancylostoma duodenale TaxID=51022 RepID=A0A0C2CMU4_9BILA|nr:hypothetical protein ANCDUO_11857 [Ancylostoma duodenale]